MPETFDDILGDVSLRRGKKRRPSDSGNVQAIHAAVEEVVQGHFAKLAEEQKMSKKTSTSAPMAVDGESDSSDGMSPGDAGATGKRVYEPPQRQHVDHDDAEERKRREADDTIMEEDLYEDDSCGRLE